MPVTEPKIRPEEILVLLDDDFNGNSVCIVTGAAGGVGRATAVAAAANGLMTVGLDVDEAEGRRTQKMARDVGGQMVFFPVGLDRDDDISAAVDEAAKLGTIKYLANIAGIHYSHLVEEFPMDAYDLVQRISLRAPFFLSKLCIPHMKRSESGSGVIGNLTSVHAHVGTPHQSVYAMTQFGLRGLSQSISAEGNGRIRSFTVSSGPVRTGQTADGMAERRGSRNPGPASKVSEILGEKSGAKDPLAPIEVANVFMFGFSRYARYLVGGDLLFDGGAVLTH
jgi:3-hydroxybutyrate dehydrogenase